MNTFKTLLILFSAILLNLQAKSQILSGLLSNTFEQITVNKRAVFSGEVQLNQGLWLNGRAQLSDGLTSIGGMDVSGDIVFNSLSLVTDLSENALVVVDPQGNIRRLSGFDALQSIIENRAIDFQQEISMPELSVLQNLKLFGAVELGEDVLFSGDAAFADDVRIGQSLNVTEEIRTATAIVENLEVNESIRTTGLVAEGVIESAGLSTEGIIKAAAVEADRVDVENTLRIGAMALDTALGTTAFVTTSTTGELLRMGEEQLAVALGPIFTPRPSECLTNPGGESIPRWNYDVNKIVIDDCSRGTASVGIGTLEPQEKLHVVGGVQASTLHLRRNTQTSPRISAEISGQLLVGGHPNGVQNLERHIILGYDNSNQTSFIETQSDADASLYLNPTNGAAVQIGSLSTPAETARLFLGDFNHGLEVKKGVGMALNTFENPNALVIRSQSGFVGIGKSNPSHPLDVSGRLNANELQIEGGNALIRGSGNFDATDDEATVFLGDNNHGITATREVGLSLWTFQHNNALVIRQQNGFVGIGKSNPSHPLDVSGRLNANELQIEGGNATVKGANNFAAVADEAYLYLGDTEHSIMAKRGTGVSLSTFGAEKALTVQEGTGNIGIGMGTDAPQAKLHVESSGVTAPILIKHEGTERFKVAANGNTYAKEVFVQLESFPDYVFENDYQQMALEDLAAYITKNGKLPKMPSAQEVKDEGANVGEIMKLLVEKVEELTLNVIQLNEQNKALKNEIETLKSK